MNMKNKIIIFGIVIVCFTFLIIGCSKNIYDTPEEEKLSQTPTISEIANVISEENYQASVPYMITALQDQITKIKNSDIKKAMTMVTEIINTYQSVNYIEDKNSGNNITYVLKSAKDMAILCSYSSSNSEAKPILIIDDAKLTRNGSTKNVTLVLLGGTEFKNGQATDIYNDVLSGMALNNEYLYDVYYAIQNHFIKKEGKINYNHELILQGISLGGMVSQQLAALYAEYEKEGVENFKVPFVTTYGSPLLVPEKIGNFSVVRRMVEANDLVPKLSVYYQGIDYIAGDNDTAKFSNVDNKYVCRESYYDTTIGAHAAGYISSNWDNVDVLGFENGDATITFTSNNMNWYPAPKKNSSN